MTQRNRKDISKPVAQYDLEGNLIAIYSSGAEASRRTGVDKNNLRSVCRGVVKSAGGYK